jgi:para-nitrobenzyl esterase
MDAMKTGKLNDVPLLTGWNAGDNLFFGNPQSAESFKAEAENKYGSDAPEFLKLFPAGTEEESKNSQNILGMLSFGGSNYNWSMLQNEFGHKPVYLYYFSHVPPGLPDYGAFHSAEFGYALKTLKFWDRPFTDYDYQLAETMSSYWVNFASGGNPNSGKDLPEWPVFRNNTKQVMIFGDAVKSGEVPFREQLDFLDKMREKGNKNKSN